MKTWLEKTQQQLRNAPRWLSLSQIAQDTGLKVAWLSSFAAGHIKDPGIKKMQTLHDYLTVSPYQMRPERVRYGETPNSAYRAGVFIVWETDFCLFVGQSDDMESALSAQRDLFRDYKPTHVDFIFTGDGKDGDERRDALAKIKVTSLRPVLNRRKTK